MTETGTAGAAADATADLARQDRGAASTGGQPDVKVLLDAAIKDAAEWKQRFSGMQGRYQQEHDALLKTQAAVSELTVKFEAVTGDHGALESEVDTLTKSLAELKNAKDGSDSQLGRLTALMEYPQLMPMEVKGLLPAGTGDDFKSKLATLAETLKAQGISNTLSEGGTRPAPSAASKDRATLLAELRQYQSEGKTTEYDTAYKALLDADAKRAS